MSTRASSPELSGHVVLVGHRGAGKSRLLAAVADRLRRPAIDLDALIAEREGVTARALFERSEGEFRAAERRAFTSVSGAAVIAAGGGFLAHHADLLAGHTPVLVPIDFPTYRERMRADRTRPRLRPELSLEEEIAAVFAEREALHAQVPTLPIAAVLVSGSAGHRVRPRTPRGKPPQAAPGRRVPYEERGEAVRPVRVVTLPSGADAVAFARRARDAGADALEVRDDLTPSFDAAAVSAVLPLLLAERGGPGFSAVARRLARWQDGELGPIVSHHFATPLTPGDAEAFWVSRPGHFIKHVEPLVDSGAHLLETQRRLVARFGEGRVTVLCTGPCALPWRAVLARRNAFDYLALDGEAASAPGQRLLADAVRAGAGDGPRHAIIGHRIAGSRSPRVHPAPFDRWDLPPDAPVARLVEELREHYRGFAITSPFKHRFVAVADAGCVSCTGRGESAANIASHGVGRTSPSGQHLVGASDAGSVSSTGGGENAANIASRGIGLASPSAARLHAPINTLVRRPEGWLAANTDVDGARAVLERWRVGDFTVLGDGGAAWALRHAARRAVTTLKARAARAVTGDVFWTWPEHLPTPAGLRLDGARVFVVCYGAPAVRLAARVRSLGGTPVRAGAAWFVAQARAQRLLWGSS